MRRLGGRTPPTSYEVYLDIAARQFGLLDPLVIKGQFSRVIEKGERISQSRLKRGVNVVYGNADSGDI